MAIIKSMKLKGFKSFPKQIDLEFGTGFNCVIGPNGSGKCLREDSEIILSDGSIEKIGRLVNKKIKTNPTREFDDGIIAVGNDKNILSMNLETKKLEERPILTYVKRKAPKGLIKIKTKSGKEIISTKYHPLFIMENGEIKPIKAENLKEGIRIATPRKLHTKIKTTYFYELIDQIKEKDQIYVPYQKEFTSILKNLKKNKTWKALAKEINIPLNSIKGLIDKQSINFSHVIKILKFVNYNNEKIISLIKHVKAKNQNKTYKIPWKNSKEFSRFLGYLIAEGRLPPTSNQIWFTNGDEEIVKDYLNIIRKLFNIKTEPKEYKPACWDVILYSSPLRKILTKFGMPIGNTGEKNLTNLYLSHSTDQELGEFLDGYYSGDGHISKNEIEIVTKSKNLAFKINTILLRLGIISYSKLKLKIATNSNFSGVYHYQIISNNQSIKNFYKHVKLTHKGKQKRLETLIKKEANSNDDLIEANNLVKNITKELNISIKKLKTEYPRLDSYCYNQCTPSREGLNHIVNQVLIPQAQKQNKTLQLCKLKLITESDIFWDKIIEIEDVKGEKWVYDLCISEHHNFVANNIIVHNSNIMDALCFVLGKLSAKSMRAEKSANLIFNGGKKGNPLREAEVSIIFDNSNQTFPTNTEEVKLTRVIKNTGNSVYKINNETRTRQQIIELLTAGKIDPNGHNIILQGDIVRFMEMHPEHRRELIEEIAGISVFEDKKAKALNELTKVDSKLNDATLILKERESYLRELKKEKDQAEKYRELEKNIKRNRATHLHIQIKDKNTKKEEIESKIKKKDADINKLKSRVKEIWEKINNKKQKLNQINTDIEEKGEKESIQLQKNIEDIKTEFVKNTERLSACKNEIKKITERKEQLKKSEESTISTIKGLKESRTETLEKLKKSGEKEEKLSKEVENLKKSLGLKLNTDLDKINNQLEEKTSQYEETQKRNQNIIQKKFQINAQIESTNEKITTIEKIEKDTNTPKIRKDLESCSKDLSKSLTEDSSLSIQLIRAKENYQKISEQFFKLRTQQSSIKESIGADLAIRKILTLKDQNVHGTVSQLGQVDQKFSLALSVAAGARIKSLVVKDDKTAAKCIDILKKTKSGIATFLPMNKIKSRPKTTINGTGIYGSAIDLIKFDNKFKDVFSYVFSNTLIVENIETARRVGIGKVRMVTLEGDVIETSGAMIGGYRAKTAARITFQEKKISSNLETIEKDLNQATKLKEMLEKKKAQNEELIHNLRRNKSSIEAELIKAERSLPQIPLANLRKQLDSLKEDKVFKEHQGIERELQKIITDINSLKKQRDSIKKKVSPNKDSSQLDNLESRKLKIHEEIVQMNTEIKNIDTQITNIYDPEKEKTIQIIKQQEKEIEEFKKEYSLLEDLLKKQKQDLRKKESDQDKFKKSYKDLFNTRNKTNDEIQKLEASTAVEAAKEKTINERVNEFSIERAKKVAELEALNSEFEEFKGIELRRNIPQEKLKEEIKNFEVMLARIGNVNLRAVEIYESIEKEYEELVRKSDKLKEEKDDVINLIEEIETNKKGIFIKTFNVLNKNFSRIFSNLSRKGEGQLELEDKEDPLSAGVNIKVRVIGNKFLDIKSLSGGEKTMTALAFIFAIQEYQPAAFYLLDEVDAALDKKNSELLASLVAKYSENSQYVMISHNDHVITEADYVYGISMHETGISKVVSLKL